MNSSFSIIIPMCDTLNLTYLQHVLVIFTAQPQNYMLIYSGNHHGDEVKSNDSLRTHRNVKL